MMCSEDMAIQTFDVSKTYCDGAVCINAVRGIDLAITRGEFLAIVGPSGSGKSTLLSLLGAIDTPTSGRVLIEGTDLSSLNDDRRTLLRRRRLGFIFQAFNLLPTLTALENVALPLELDGTSTPDARTQARTALESVAIGHRLDHLPSMLSGGEQQRVAVARALVIQPAVLLADEPTGNLDSQSGQQIVALFRHLVESMRQTVVIVTHDMQVAMQANRIVRLRDGRVECEERPAAKFRRQLNASAGPDGTR
jgi:putative ABC transport system ATP-binding protein